VLKISLRNIVIYVYGVIKNNNNNKGGGWVRAAAAGVRTFPPIYVSPGHGFRERVYGSDTSGHGVSRLYYYRVQKYSVCNGSEVI